jgi:TonB family protein
VKQSAESALAGALGAPAMPRSETPPKPPSIEQINNTMSDREFHALYKDEFDHFTPNQKKFIKNNLNRIQAITQHYLTMRGYPPFAAQQRMQGVNVVEFYLHPNGDITDLKVIASSGFDVLDDNSLDTIKTAYKDYPRPKEKTKIRFYIHYRIY